MAGLAVRCAGASVAVVLADGWRHRRRRDTARQPKDDARLFKSTPAECSSCNLEMKRSKNVMRREDFVFRNRSDFHKEYAVTGTLGEGASAEVVKATHKRTGIQRAVKRVPKANMNVDMFETEVRSLITLDHPHIVKVIEYFEEEDHFFLVEEFLAGSDLFDYIVGQQGYMSEWEASVIFRQCLKAVVCCHVNGIMHRDLKPENFMLAGRLRTIKLIDFGLAQRHSCADASAGAVGTVAYMAPEIALRHGTYGPAVDMWSLGVVLYALLTGSMLLPQDERKAWQAIRDPEYVARRLRNCPKLQERGLSASARSLLTRLLEWDPAKRLTAAEALAHPFVTAHLGDQMSEDGTRMFWEFDRGFVDKLRRFARAPRLRRTGQLIAAHLAADPRRARGQRALSPRRRSEASTCPAVETQDMMQKARMVFRSLDMSGRGRITLDEIQARLEREGLEIPSDLGELFENCDANASGDLNFAELVAVLLVDASWTDSIYRETFWLLDRTKSGVLEAADLEMLHQSAGKAADFGKSEYEAIIREVDTDGKGYVNYDDFRKLMTTT